MLRFVCLLLAVIGARCMPASIDFEDEADGPLEIIGGHPVTIEEVPFQISMEMDGSHYCGGSILSKRWVLTAAHCVDYVTDVSQVAVRYGTDVREDGGTLVQASWVGAHDQYDGDVHSHDVALIQVAEDIVFSSRAQPVKMAPVGEEPRMTDTLSVSGWGLTNPYDLYDHGSVNLLAVTVPYVPRATCQISYVPSGHVIDDSMICAGISGKDACQGDSGGPLVNALGVQVGVASWSVVCGSPGFAGVYADLANSVNRDWIQNKTGITA